MPKKDVEPAETDWLLRYGRVSRAYRIFRDVSLRKEMDALLQEARRAVSRYDFEHP